MGSPCAVMSHRSTCQVSGRMAPYLVDACNMTYSATWSHMNLTGTRLLFCMSDSVCTKYYTMTSASLELLQHHISGNYTMVKSSESRSFKLTSSPQGCENMESANKNTCMIIRNDGSFRVQGLPRDATRVCRGFRDGISNISSGPLWIAFLMSLQLSCAES